MRCTKGAAGNNPWLSGVGGRDGGRDSGDAASATSRRRRRRELPPYLVLCSGRVLSAKPPPPAQDTEVLQWNQRTLPPSPAQKVQ